MEKEPLTLSHNTVAWDLIPTAHRMLRDPRFQHSTQRNFVLLIDTLRVISSNLSNSLSFSFFTSQFLSISELRLPVGQIVTTEKNIFAVDSKKVNYQALSPLCNPHYS